MLFKLDRPKCDYFLESENLPYMFPIIQQHKEITENHIHSNNL